MADSIVHSIASVYLIPAYRGHGVSRLMRELAIRLPSCQTEDMDCAGSVLYSDIGKTHYAKFGWHLFPDNTHVELQIANTHKSAQSFPVFGRRPRPTLQRRRGCEPSGSRSPIRRNDTHDACVGRRPHAMAPQESRIHRGQALWGNPSSQRSDRWGTWKSDPGYMDASILRKSRKRLFREYSLHPTTSPREPSFCKYLFA